MHRISIWLVLASSFLFFYAAKSVDNDARDSLVEFYRKLSSTNGPVSQVFRWNLSSDPCQDQSKRIICDSGTLIVRKILLNASANSNGAPGFGYAAIVSNAIAVVHKELCKDKITHGNLKSSNILLNKNMDPIITEYGLMETNNEYTSLFGNFLVPKMPLNQTCTGSEWFCLSCLLGKWFRQMALTVVREEWTVEVFNRSLIEEGMSEERMVNLLLIAVKCVDRSPEARPSINQVAVMVNTLKEEEERSICSES